MPSFLPLKQFSSDSQNFFFSLKLTRVFSIVAMIDTKVGLNELVFEYLNL